MRRARFVSFAMVLGVGFMLLVSPRAFSGSVRLDQMDDGFLATTLSGARAQLWHRLHNHHFAFSPLIYKVLRADAEIQWHDVWIGAAGTSFYFPSAN
jgi:uncharacterized BrkB/YihY/UPF0761 family membrane protein